jgi:cysteine synthase A
MRYSSMVDAIGHTPLVRLTLPNTPHVDVFAKLELQNIFAMKDRVARQIVLSARESGELRPGTTILESSSGTMALGVALVGTALGHPVHIVTDPRIDPITRAKLESLGCVVDVVPRMSAHGWQSARLERLDQVRRELGESFWPRQYSNPQNPAAYRALADELVLDLGGVDVLVGAVGSGGSLCGTARMLRRTNQDLRVVGVDCVGSVLFGQPDQPHRLQSGLGNSLIPPNLDHSLIDEVHWLNDREAYESTRRLAREQQIFAGNTSGSVYRVLTHVAAGLPASTRVVGILPDRGDRYAETVYSDEHWKRHQLQDQPDREAPALVDYGEPVSAWSYSRLGGGGDDSACV